jgi:hypothetical protein
MKNTADRPAQRYSLLIRVWGDFELFCEINFSLRVEPMSRTPWPVKVKRYVASVTWNRLRPDDPLLYRDLAATVLQRIDGWLGEAQPLSGNGLLRWYRDGDCDPGNRQLGGARAILEQLTDIGERLGPKPLRLSRLAIRRFDDGLEHLDELGYAVKYRADDLPAAPDDRAIKAAYQFDVARGVLRRMTHYPDDTPRPRP